MQNSKAIYIDYNVIHESASEKAPSRAEHPGPNQDHVSPSTPVTIRIYGGRSPLFVPLHCHSDLEVIYARDCSISLIIDGNKTKVDPGGFALISNGALHCAALSAGQERRNVLSVFFREDYLTRMWPRLLDTDFGAPMADSAAEAGSHLSALLEELLLRVKDTQEGEEPHFEANQLLFAILQYVHYMYLPVPQRYSGRQRVMRDKMAEILDYMNRCYREDLTTQSVADRFMFTREYFCRLFKRYAGETFKSYLTGIRLAAVAERLRNSERGIAQIASDEGFPDEKSFFTAFKRAYGVTPAQWRAANGTG